MQRVMSRAYCTFNYNSTWTKLEADLMWHYVVIYKLDLLKAMQEKSY